MAGGGGGGDGMSFILPASFISLRARGDAASRGGGAAHGESCIPAAGAGGSISAKKTGSRILPRRHRLRQLHPGVGASPLGGESGVWGHPPSWIWGLRGGVYLLAKGSRRGRD